MEATMPFVDFASLKERVKIEDAAAMLGLPMKQTGEQMRAPCPHCKSGGDRALVITPSKQLFYCFSAKTGGDLIKLVSHVRNVAANEAAVSLDRHFGGTSDNSSTAAGNSTSGTVPQSGSGKDNPATRSLQPLTYLQAEHDLVQGLGIEKETAEQFQSGYAPKGILRGRYAVPIHTRDAQLVGYCGIAVKDDQQPRLLFPNGFTHTSFIFNAHNVESGDLLYVTKEPLSAIVASQNGIENVVSFFGDVTADALDVLKLLMDERQIPCIEFC